MKFSHALGLALLMVALAWIGNGRPSAGWLALIVLYLVLAAILPGVMVPVGIAIVIAMLVGTPTGQKAADWLKGLAQRGQ